MGRGRWVGLAHQSGRASDPSVRRTARPSAHERLGYALCSLVIVLPAGESSELSLGEAFARRSASTPPAALAVGALEARLTTGHPARALGRIRPGAARATRRTTAGPGRDRKPARAWCTPLRPDRAGPGSMPIPAHRAPRCRRLLVPRGPSGAGRANGRRGGRRWCRRCASSRSNANTSTAGRCRGRYPATPIKPIARRAPGPRGPSRSPWHNGADSGPVGCTPARPRA